MLRVGAKTDWNWSAPNRKWLGVQLEARFYREDVKAKQENDLIGYRLNSYLIWGSLFGFVVGCP